MVCDCLCIGIYWLPIHVSHLPGHMSIHSHDACMHLGIFVVSGYECAYIPMMLGHIWWVVLDAHIQMVIQPHDTCTCLGPFLPRQQR